MKGIGYYPYKGKKLPSVTAILDYTLGFGDGLLDWAVKEGAAKLMREMKLARQEKRRMTIEDAKKIAMSARMDKLNSARDVGTAVHDAIHNFLDGDEKKRVFTNPTADKLFESFLNWQEQNRLIPVAMEQLVIEDELGYAGRFDFYGLLNGEKVLVDFKTSNYIKPEMGLQLSAYKHCLERSKFEVERMFIVHIKASGTELVEFQDKFSLFQNVRQLFDWKQEFNEAEWYPRMTESAMEEELIYGSE